MLLLGYLGEVRLGAACDMPTSICCFSMSVSKAVKMKSVKLICEELGSGSPRCTWRITSVICQLFEHGPRC